MSSSGTFEVVPWFMRTTFGSRQNHAGALETSQINPAVSGLGDLFDMSNEENAAGGIARFQSPNQRLGSNSALITEAGLFVRAGRTEQRKNLLDPATLATWDRRLDAGITTVDTGAYLDADVRVGNLRVSGGARGDLLFVSVDDRLANYVPPGGTPSVSEPREHRDAAGIAFGPRVTAEYDVARGLAISTSYGEGFRSLDAAHVKDGSTKPFSKVRSVEGGLRAEASRHRFRTTLSAFRTWVENELVFVVESGGFETEQSSVRQGIVGSFFAKPYPWLLCSMALSITDAAFETRIPGISHHVPNVPPILFRFDTTLRRTLADVGGRPLVGRLGAGYTFLSRRHLTDAIRGPSSNILNVGIGLRYGAVEVAVDGYNVLGHKYADNADVYISNWSMQPGQQLASMATHLTAAPPRIVVGTVTLQL